MSATPLTISDPLEILFKPARIGGVDLPNRIAMAPMTRAMSPGGVPGENVARYYRRRAEGGAHPSPQRGSRAKCPPHLRR